MVTSRINDTKKESYSDMLLVRYNHQTRQFKYDQMHQKPSKYAYVCSNGSRREHNHNIIQMKRTTKLKNHFANAI